jgi:hypothetical protein
MARCLSLVWLGVIAAMATSTASGENLSYSVEALPSTAYAGSQWYQIVYRGMSHRNQVLTGGADTIVCCGSRAFLFRDGRRRPLSTLPSPGSDDASRVNSRGDAIGRRGDYAAGTLADVRWRADGGVDELGTGADTNAVVSLLDISESAVVAGAITDVGRGWEKATVWTGVQPLTLPRPTGHDDEPYASATAISPGGRFIAGTLGPGPFYPFNPSVGAPAALVVWHDHQPVSYQNAGAGWVLDSFSINDRGEAAATGFPLDGSGPVVAYKLDVTGLHRLPPLHAGDTAQANGINRQGWVAGTGVCQCAHGYHGALWRDGGVVDVNDLLDAPSRAAGWVVQTVYAIDDANVLLGYAFNDQDPATNGYVLLKPRQ